MSAARKQHFDLGEVMRRDLAPEPPEPAAQKAGGEDGKGERDVGRPARRAEERTDTPDGLPEPMTLEDLARVKPEERRQLNAGVPHSLMLHKRLALYREDHGHNAHRQNVIALAVDEWLRGRGY